MAGQGKTKAVGYHGKRGAASGRSGIQFVRYLALIALAGLLVNLFWNAGRADSTGALAIIPFILHEAREALRGKACACS